MTEATASAALGEMLRRAFGDSLQESVPMARYTSARIGGPADFLLVVGSSAVLGETCRTLWQMDVPFWIMGAGSNVLVADRGIRGVVVLNQARKMRFYEDEAGPQVWAESGAALGVVARRAVDRGWAGLEWAATVPGTVGGAVVGNAGAHGADMASSLRLVEILHRDGGVESWPVERLEYGYRESLLKRNPGLAVVLSATLGLERSTPEATKAKMAELVAQRRRTQPSGASIGSMFKNPPGDHAGRLIEAAGLKGKRHGGAQISPKHANFFVNQGGATADDVMALIQISRQKVADQHGVDLDLEVELVGEWNPGAIKDHSQAEAESDG